MSSALRIAATHGRDWLDWVSALSGAVGALLAGGAIWYSRVQGVHNQRALVRERRVEFDLELLAKMSEQFDVTDTQHLAGFLRAFVRSDTPDDDLPVTRVVLDVRPTEVGRVRYREIVDAVEGESAGMTGQLAVREALHREVAREIDRAIERRVNS